MSRGIKAVLIGYGFLSCLTVAAVVLRFIYPAYIIDILPAGRVCNSQMAMIKSAAEAYYEKQGRAAASCAELVENGYLNEQMLTNPHSRDTSAGCNYAIVMAGGEAVVRCNNDHLYCPPGHIPDRDGEPAMDAIQVLLFAGMGLMLLLGVGVAAGGVFTCFKRGVKNPQRQVGS
jgi:competence protein ComGC